MRRIIGTIGATLAIVAVVAISAAPVGASRPGISGDGIDQDELVSASNSSVHRINANTGIAVAESMDGNLNPGTPQVIGSAYTNAEPDDDADGLGDESQDPDLGGLGGGDDDWEGPVTGGGEDISEMIALFDDEGDDWFDELEEDEFDSAGIEWLEITSYEQLPAYPSINDVYMARAASAGGTLTTSGGRWDRGIPKTIGIG
jgi:hypothetical protein